MDETVDIIHILKVNNGIWSKLVPDDIDYR